MTIHSNNLNWVLETDHTAYVLGLYPNGMVVHSYWGTRLPDHDDYLRPPAAGGIQVGPYTLEEVPFNGLGNVLQEEYPAYAGAKYIEPCLKATFADGVRDVVLVFDRADIIDGDTPELQLFLKDAHYPLEVCLHYRVWSAFDLIERFATITNTGDTPVTLERVWSAQWQLPAGEQYHMSHLHGHWANEFQLTREPLTNGVKVIESRRLTTSHHHSPWFAIDRGDTGEEHGDLWFGTLAWSGNWKIAAEVTSFATTRVSIGVNDWDFAWQLNSGERFVTPRTVGGYTAHGFGTASRRLHDFIRATIVPHGTAPRKVLFNSWETTMFDVDEESQQHFADIAAEMGIELYVMDDGWFHGRNTDRAGLGDWWPDEHKFPHGLTPLIEYVNKLGMEFGLWIEPEMVNPDSDLYRAHPDWVIHFPTRARTESRHQLILNLAKPEVQNYLLEHLDRLLSTHNIRFIKWDMNRNVSEPGWPDAPADQRELWVRYVHGVYHLWDALRERHPDVVWQSCSGGGGRADIEILRRADQVWISDNTNPTNRLAIQHGYSQVFPAITMEAWVTDMGDEFLPLTFRFHASMCGVLGVGADLRRWGDAELAEAKRCISLYKELRPIIQQGDMYRLRNAAVPALSGVQYMRKDQTSGVLFAFLTHRDDVVHPTVLFPRGLEPDALYRFEGQPVARTGSAWMNTGVTLKLGNFESVALRIERQ